LIGVEFTWKSFSGILGLYKFSGKVWKLQGFGSWTNFQEGFGNFLLRGFWN